jgi:hypothetical protein
MIHTTPRRSIILKNICRQTDFPSDYQSYSDIPAAPLIKKERKIVAEKTKAAQSR